MEKYLLGCDWGTSSFRLCLFNFDNQQIIDEISSEQGIGRMHAAWQNSGKTESGENRITFFRDYLSHQIKLLSDQCGLDLRKVTIVISGMASSSLGMLDVPYADLPFAIDGNNAIVKHLNATNNFPHDIMLISGVRTDNDVMRGEETQLIGVAALLQQDGSEPTSGLFIFPGTHSKHAFIESGRMVQFNTFMTGEVFNIISNHSILNASIEKLHEKSLSDDDKQAFKLGVRKSKEARILNELFTVRTNQLFQKLNKKQNYFYLSGLLIGEELNSLVTKENLNLYICSGSNLKDYYSLAIEELDLTSRSTIIPGDMVDKAALAGQQVIFYKQKLKSN